MSDIAIFVVCRGAKIKKAYQLAKSGLSFLVNRANPFIHGLLLLLQHLWVGTLLETLEDLRGERTHAPWLAHAHSNNGKQQEADSGSVTHIVILGRQWRGHCDGCNGQRPLGRLASDIAAFFHFGGTKYTGHVTPGPPGRSRLAFVTATSPSSQPTSRTCSVYCYLWSLWLFENACYVLFFLSILALYFIRGPTSLAQRWRPKRRSSG